MMKRKIALFLCISMLVTSISVPSYAGVEQTQATVSDNVIKTSETVEFKQSKTVNGIDITVSAPEGVFPTDAQLTVSQITEQSQINQIEQAIENSQPDTISDGTVSDNMVSDNAAKDSLSFDITILDAEGKEIQPDTSKGEVKVTFANVEITDAEGNCKNIEVFHVDDGLQIAEPVTTVQVDTKKQEVEIAAEHFSVYTIITGSGTTLLKCTFKWGDDDVTADAEDVCYYSDSYFATSSSTYNPSLATMSMAMAMACCGSAEQVKKHDNSWWSYNGKQLFSDLGFQNPISNETDPNALPGLDTIGVTVAYKMIPDGNGGQIPLVAVGLRGSNYQAEWGGNFTLGRDDVAGYEKDHKGFYDASSEVLKVVAGYINAQETPDELKNAPQIKFWISGFSRAAATSNLTAARLDRYIANPTAGESDLSKVGSRLIKDNLYAYTFETPAGGIVENRKTSSGSVIYSNIFNVINPQDLVPMVAPAEFSFGHYGIDLFLPTKENHVAYQNLLNHMLMYYPEKSKPYNVDQFKQYSLEWDGWIPIVKEVKNGYPSQGLFMDAFVNNLALNVIGSRNELVDKPSGAQTIHYQDAIRHLVQYTMTTTGLNAKQALWLLVYSVKHTFLCVQGYKMLFWLAVEDYQSGYINTKWNMKYVVYNAAKDLGYTEITKNGVEGGPKEIVEAISGLIPMIVDLYKSNPGYLLTLAFGELANKGIQQAHGLTLEKAWLESMDENFDDLSLGKVHTNYDEVFLCGEYRMVQIYNIAGNVKIHVAENGGHELLTYDTTGEDTLTYSTGAENKLTAGKDYDNQLVVYLPVNQGYTISVEKSSESSVTPKISYSVTEYNPTVEKSDGIGRMKRYCYYNDPVNGVLVDGILTATIGKFENTQIQQGIPEGSTYDYRLKKNGSYLEDHYCDYKLSELSNKYCNVVIHEVGDEFGLTWGDGLRMRGSNVVVHAVPLFGGTFTGWYKEENCENRLSEEPEYSFIPEEQLIAGNTINLYAKFDFTAKVTGVTAINSATNVGKTEITVAWNPLSTDSYEMEGIKGYNIYRKDGSGNFELIGTVDAKDANGNYVTSYVDPVNNNNQNHNPSAGTEYTYIVKVLSIMKDGNNKYIESTESSNEALVMAGAYWRYEDVNHHGVASGYTVDAAHLPQGVVMTSKKQNDPINSHFKVQSGYDYVTSYDIKLSPENASFIPPVKLQLEVGNQYNGRTAVIQHYVTANGGDYVETFSSVVENSIAEIEVTSLSPFFVTISKLPVPQPTPDNGNTSTYSGSSQTTDYPVPYAPQYVQAQNYGMDLTGKPQVMLLWQKPAMDEAGLRQIAGYSVYRDGVWIGTVNGVNTLYYIDNTVENGKTYRYTVKTLGIEGGTESVASNEAVITVDALTVGTVDLTFAASKAAGEATAGNQAGLNHAAGMQTGKNQSGEAATKTNQEEAVQADNPVVVTNPAQQAQNITDSANTEAAGSQQAMELNRTGIFAGGIAKVAVPVGIGVLLLCGLLILILLKRRNHDDMES